LSSKENDKFLLVQENIPAFRAGLWNWVQGVIDGDENEEEAGVREAEEETGFKVEIDRKIATISIPFPGTKEIHVYLGHRTGGRSRVNEGEIQDARWFTFRQIENMYMHKQLAGKWIIEALRSFD